MKLKTKKAKQISPVYLKANELAEAYQQGKNTEAVGKSQADRANEEIKSLAKSEGYENGNDTIINTGTYIVGYKTVNPSPELDLALAEKVLNPAILRRCTTEVLDEKKVEKLVSERSITQAQLLKMVKPKPSYTKVIVEEIGKPKRSHKNEAAKKKH